MQNNNKQIARVGNRYLIEGREYDKTEGKETQFQCLLCGNLISSTILYKREKDCICDSCIKELFFEYDQKQKEKKKKEKPFKIKYIDKPFSFTEVIYTLNSNSRECPCGNSHHYVKFMTRLFNQKYSGSVKAELIYCSKCKNYFILKAEKERIKSDVYPKYSFAENNAKPIFRGETELQTKENNSTKANSVQSFKKESDFFEKELPDRIHEIPSVVITIDIANVNLRLKERYYIVTDFTAERPKENILHYSRDKARELLTAALYERREKVGQLDGVNYRVINVEYPQSENRIPETLLPKKLVIQSPGGYKSSIVNRNYELVDLLLYAPFTQKYEILVATYAKKENYCFVAQSRFRQFLNDYGKPDVPIKLGSAYRAGTFGELRDESLLRSFGYSVAEGGPSTSQRQEILADVVDLEWMTTQQIANFLEFLIDTHNQPQMDNARIKWKTDKQFIMNYNVNTERFLVAKTK